MVKFSLKRLMLCLALVLPGIASSQDQVTVYIDADYTLTQHPAEAIEAGLLAAISSHPNAANVRVITIDNRANARRSNDTLATARNDPNAVAVFGGMHSPHYLVNLEQINNSGMPLLLPWSAAGPLTRGAQGDQNWVFRLSVDDQKAADHLYSVALERGCQRPAAIAVDNPWGRYNMSELQNAADARAQILSEALVLHNTAGERTVTDAAERIMQSRADCVVLVAGFELTSTIIAHLAKADAPPKIISHWGILGGRITERVDFDSIMATDLEVLGTCGLHQYASRSTYHAAAERHAPETMHPREHPAPHGFYHAFDLGRLFLRALDHARLDAQWDQGIDAQRDAIRRALHNLEGTYEGLIADYRHPFQPVTPQTPDGHEALDREDLCMTRVARNGNLEPVFHDHDPTAPGQLDDAQLYHDLGHD
jgi:branched-chain amino acid transport system substrate-binding protein